MPVFCFSDKTGKFPEYPSDEEGGSAMLFKEKTPEEVEIDFVTKFFMKESSKCYLEKETGAPEDR